MEKTEAMFFRSVLHVRIPHTSSTSRISVAMLEPTLSQKKKRRQIARQHEKKRRRQNARQQETT